MDSARSWLESVARMTPQRWLRRVPGRETFAWPGPASSRGPIVVKRFEGGEYRERLRERLTGHVARSSARREAENLRDLGDAGVPVPRAVAWFEERRACSLFGRGGRSCLLMTRVAHAETLRDRLARTQRAERRQWLVRLAELVARLHASGFYHRDLYLQHFVLGSSSGSPPLVLLDVGRVRHASPPRRRWIVKDLAALLHSAPPAMDWADYQGFLAEYLGLRGRVAGGQNERWESSIRAKARRLAAHEPRANGDLVSSRI